MTSKLDPGLDPDDPWYVDNLKAELAAAVHNAMFAWQEYQVDTEDDGYASNTDTLIKLEWYPAKAEYIAGLLRSLNVAVTLVPVAYPYGPSDAPHEHTVDACACGSSYYPLWRPTIYELLDTPVPIELMHASLHPAVADDY